MIGNMNEIIRLGVAVGLPSLTAIITAGKILSWRTIVPVDKMHIVQTRKKTTSYGKESSHGNVYYEWPKWIPVLGVDVKELPVTNFNILIDRYEAYDQDRVPFVVDIHTFFRISDTDRAAERVSSFDELKGHLAAIVQGAVRNIMAKAPLQEIMEERSKYGQQFTDAVSEQLKEWGVVAVKNIELMDIRDSAGSSVIANIMAKKMSEIEKDSRVTVAENKKLAETAEIEAAQEVDVKKADTARIVGEKEAERDQLIGIAQEKSKQEIAESAKTTAEKDLAVEKVKALTQAQIDQEKAVIDAETVKKQTIIQANQDKEKRIIDTEAEREQIQIQTDAEKYNVETIATAKLDAAKKDADAVIAAKMAEAKGVKEVGTAAADAEKQMQLARVTAETTLAEKIGENKGYQEYLVNLETVQRNADVEIERAKQNALVGVEQAKALEKANISVVANTGGSVQSGLQSVGDLFTPEFATKLGAADTALKNAADGKGFIDTMKEVIEKFALVKGVNQK
ncbi:MAG: SPFH domain-containing protein [Alphaproteobacteria bacterium]|nr:SPFH domain-containing protein [Alphaproteobacteria bacterium]MCL2758393.1 SPFH domain-containing protein [Alphaproteobacteria bacterium]